VISNETTGDFTVTANLSGQTGTEIAQDSKGVVYSDASDIRNAVTITVPESAVPIGAVSDYAGLTAPTGWLLAYGQAVSRTTYSGLYGVIGTTYGVGDGVTTFNLPDLRGRVVAGQDDMGGTSANRLIDAGSQSLNGDTMADTGGEEVHTMTSAELVAHTHDAGSYAVGAHTHSAGSYAVGTTITNGTTVVTAIGTNSGEADATNEEVFLKGVSPTTKTLSLASGTVSGTSGSTQPSFSGTSSSTGSTTPFNVVQPTIILNKIIYAGV